MLVFERVPSVIVTLMKAPVLGLVFETQQVSLKKTSKREREDKREKYKREEKENLLLLALNSEFYIIYSWLQWNHS